MQNIEDLTHQMNLIKIQSEANKKLVILYDKDTLKHASTKQHPQNPQRLQNISECLKQKNLLDSDDVKVISTLKPLERQLIIQTHGENYTQFVLNMWPQDDKRKQIYINIDTYFMKDTISSALLAAGGVKQAVDQVLEGKHSSAFAIVRPPGHHAGLKSQPHGFCFLNNVGLGAKYAQKKYNKERILILDWDAHHGQGTQNIFYSTKNIMYASLHRFDNGNFFPHVPSSSSSFTGKDEGLGYNINIGWNVRTEEPYQTCGDNQYVYAFQRLLLPIFKQFNPDLIFISCGFDSGCDDPIGGLEVTSKGYQYMTEQMKSFNVPLIVVLQGGYNFETLKWGSETVVKSLLNINNNQQTNKLKQSYIPNRVGIFAVQCTINQLKSFWQINTQQLLYIQSIKLKQLLKSIPYAKPQPQHNMKKDKHHITKQSIIEDNKITTSKARSKQQDNISIITTTSTGPTTRSKTRQIQKQQQI